MQSTILRLIRKDFDKEHISGEVGRDGLIRYMTEEKRREGAGCGSPHFFRLEQSILNLEPG
jgi:hypothetical protein